MATVKDWKKYYAATICQGQEYAMKFADTASRLKKHTLKLKKERAHTVLLEKPPKKKEPEQCKARTMAGKKCAFKAVCGEYCKKHSV